MSLTSIARRQQTISTAPPGYTGYTLENGECESEIYPLFYAANGVQSL